jgi:hypothetical protein
MLSAPDEAQLDLATAQGRSMVLSSATSVVGNRGTCPEVVHGEVRFSPL